MRKISILSLLIFLTVSCKITTSVKSHKVNKISYKETIKTIGTIKAKKEFKLNPAFEANLLWVEAEGKYVKKGDLLAILDSKSKEDSYNEEIVEYDNLVLAYDKKLLDVDNSLKNSSLEIKILENSYKIEKLNQLDISNRVDDIKQTELNSKIDSSKAEIKQLEKKYSDYKELYLKKFISINQLNELSNEIKIEKITLNIHKMNLEKLFSKKANSNKKRLAELKIFTATQKLNQAKSNYEKDKKIFKLEIKEQKTLMNTQKHELDRYKNEFESSKVYSKHDGILIHGKTYTNNNYSKIKVGEQVFSHMPFLKVAKLDVFEIECYITEVELKKLKLNQKAFVKLYSNENRTFLAKVTKIHEVAENISRLDFNRVKKIKVILEIEKRKDLDLKPGISVSIDIITHEENNIYALPLDFVEYDYSKNRFYYFNENFKKIYFNKKRSNSHYIIPKDELSKDLIVYKRMNKNNKKKLKFEKYVVKKGYFENSTKIFGTMNPKDMINVSSTTNGKLTYVNKDGKNVKTDEIIMKIENDDLEKRLKMYENSLKQSSSEIQISKKNLDINLKSYKKNLELAEIRYKISKINYDVLKKSIDKKKIFELESEIRDTVLDIKKAMIEYELNSFEFEKGKVTKLKINSDKDRLKSLYVKLSSIEKNYEKAKSKNYITTEIEISRLEYLNSKLKYDFSKHKFKSAKESLNNSITLLYKQIERKKKEIITVKNRLKLHEIKSPKSGVLLISKKRNWGPNQSDNKYKVGDKVWFYRSLFNVAKLTNFIIDSEINEENIGNIKLGSSIEFTLNIDKETIYNGKVSEISIFAENKNTMDLNSSKVFKLKIDISSISKKFQPGMTADIKVIFSKKESAVTIPRDFIYYENEKPYVYSSKKSKKFIDIIDYNKENACINGLNENETIYKRIYL